ncbi:flagellar hook capping FlgD N-terminal domain-containing protein [Cohnella sp. REN36]|uniref:flagellar hook capping FlgD N-terminal domain-containing protein n=1 Tax=Cohnella sp. REN36 TaxID=2887347 RepID=UPI001D15790E|nr:flagellar hook capping FlgD N-terminal domain-containing protein [Cohnella sp. REN36]MCC3376234.1 flagellar hook capping protein [Cohnella sp. REN36]
MASSPGIGNKLVWPNYSSGNVSKAAATPSKELGKDEFLKILVTQLKNQDPMQPMEDKEFISQMAQFSALEQTMNMASELHRLTQSAAIASNLIGMQASWIGMAENGTTQTMSGIVQSIVMRNGEQYAQIGKSEVKISDLTSVTIPTAPGGAPEGEETAHE